MTFEPTLDSKASLWPQDGFIVQSWIHEGQLRITGRLVDGKSFALIIDDPQQELFLASQSEQLFLTLQAKHQVLKQLRLDAWHSFAGEKLLRIALPLSKKAQVTQILSSAKLALVKSEASEEQIYFLDRSIRRTIRLAPSQDSKIARGRRVDLVISNPSIYPVTNRLGLRWLSIDIETKEDMQIVAVGIVWGICGQQKLDINCLEDREGAIVFWRGVPLQASHIRSFATEAAMLEALSDQIRGLDPDVITGWNVIDFDLRVLAKRYLELKLTFDWARTDDQPCTVTLSQNKALFANIPGRQVLDAMRLARVSGEHFDDYKLGTVASHVLGRTKLNNASGLEKLKELDHLYNNDPMSFCEYCLEDARLALDIVDKLGLAALTYTRAALTGVSLERAWTSIPSFEQTYSLELRKLKILEPSKYDRTVAEGAEGGTVLDAIPGLFENVLVLDFRSLYPSIMRTFSIDPLAYQRCNQNVLQSNTEESIIRAPNGAYFDSRHAILPKLLTDYARSRTQAIAEGDEVASYVYKILQNSFYGVLGSAACRYGLSSLAGAITSFGKYFLYFARDFCTKMGHRVLYGDTDSVFIQLPVDYSLSALESSVNQLVIDLNSAITQNVQEVWKTSSFIEIRCDQIFKKFLIPRLRIDLSGGRGRAKGYAGLSYEKQELIIKGMEAIRSDYTDLAKDFQRQILHKLFTGQSASLVADYARETLTQLHKGLIDHKLVYKKVLRRPANDYHHGHSPQVRAAKLLGWTSQRGRIEYLMTLAGPQALSMLSSKPDYTHYENHQLRPIWESLVLSAGIETDDPFQKQLKLDW